MGDQLNGGSVDCLDFHSGVIQVKNTNDNDDAEILKVGSAESTLLLFFCPCCANFWSVYAHRMCIGAYFWLQLC